MCLDRAEGALTLHLLLGCDQNPISSFCEVHHPANTRHYQNFACFLHGWFSHVVSRIEELPQFVINALVFTTPGYL